MSRYQRTLLTIASILIILGAGNLLYGNSRLNEYSQALSSALANQASEKELAEIAQKSARPTRIERLRQRAEFYRYVTLGGKTLLALGGASLLAFLLFKRRSAQLDEPQR